MPVKVVKEMGITNNWCGIYMYLDNPIQEHPHKQLQSQPAIKGA